VAISLPEPQRRLLIYWLPSLAAGAITWIVFVILGGTPPIRAMALALVIIGASLTMRRFGAMLAIIGGLALAFSPAFWTQIGGRESLPIITLALGATGVAVALLVWLTRRPFLVIGLGLVLFAVLFWSLASTERSLRLTTLLTAWFLYLLVDVLLLTNPRPDGPPPTMLEPYHTWGLLLLLILGILNDPLFTLLVPALLLTLLLSKTRLPVWYWAIFAIIAVYGLRGIAILYLDSGWWLYPSANAENVHVPFVIADGWRQAWRWLYLINLVTAQFTVFGVLLGVIGLARMARWYPPLGMVTMIAYATYALFGLVYFGRDSAVLLLPLLMIQILWMTYAVYALSQWLQKTLNPTSPVARWLAPAIFVLLPITLLIRIAG
jgi:hypothetical protein